MKTIAKKILSFWSSGPNNGNIMLVVLPGCISGAHGLTIAELNGEDEILIRTYLLEKAIYELGYELNGSPDWVNIPLRGIYYLMSRYTQAKDVRKKKS
jgi:hypothetical protein